MVSSTHDSKLTEFGGPITAFGVRRTRFGLYHYLMVLDRLSGWLIGRTGSRPPPMESPVADNDPVVDARPTDRDRVPPRQVKTEKWPVLHYGDVPRVDLKNWKFEIKGLVDSPLSLTYDEILALPHKETLCDIHCVTRWSRLDNRFTGVSVSDLLKRAGVKPDASHVLIHAEQGFTTNLPLSDLDRPENLLTWAHNGMPLSPDHGWPLRLLVPHLVLLEEREMGARAGAARLRHARLLGAERLPHARRSMDRGALRRHVHSRRR